MADSLHVILDRQALPSGAAWHASLQSNGFPLSLDPDFDPCSFTGLLPCLYGRKKTSFLLFPAPLGDMDWEGEPPCDFGARDFCIGLEIRGGTPALLAATMAAAVLAHETDGIVVDADGSTVIPGPQALAWARGVLEAEEARARKSEAAKKRAKALGRNTELLQAAAQEEVARFIGSTPSRGTAHESRLYLHCNGPHGPRKLVIDGWILHRDGHAEMNARQLRQLCHQDGEHYWRYVALELTAKAEAEIVSASLGSDLCLEIGFSNGYGLTIDPAREQGYPALAEWKMLVDGLEISAGSSGALRVYAS